MCFGKKIQKILNEDHFVAVNKIEIPETDPFTKYVWPLGSPIVEEGTQIFGK